MTPPSPARDWQMAPLHEKSLQLPGRHRCAKVVVSNDHKR